MELPELIPYTSLLPIQVPKWAPTELDPVGFNAGIVDDQIGKDTLEWLDIWTFALTFDGYKYFGDDGVIPEFSPEMTLLRFSIPEPFVGAANPSPEKIQPC